MHTYGLIGKTLSHSWSKQYFDNKFLEEGLADSRYLLLESGAAVAHPGELKEWLHRTIVREKLLGFNVTIPYKQWILPLLDELSPAAATIGAVNCVVVHWKTDGSYRLTGYNTDAPAFAETLSPLLQSWHDTALVLGTGGAAHAIAYTLSKMKIGVALVSRDTTVTAKRLNKTSFFTTSNIPLLSYSEAVQKANKIFLIVNATPIGMFPYEGATPWPSPQSLSPRHLCYDLIYNPTESRFLQECRLTGAATQNGLPMLQQQADLSWQLWHKLLNE